MNVMTDIEIGWVAGLLEGEGCFTISVQHHPQRPSSRTFPRVQLAMTDEDVVRRAHHTTGVGRIYGPFVDASGRRKPVWRWEVGKRQDVLALMSLIRPLMCERRGA